MTQEEKQEQFKPKEWALYNNGEFITKNASGMPRNLQFRGGTETYLGSF